MEIEIGKGKNSESLEIMELNRNVSGEQRRIVGYREILRKKRWLSEFSEKKPVDHRRFSGM